MDNELIARKDHRSGKTQTLCDHALSVAQAAGATSTTIGFFATSKLTGLVHDFGKASAPCQRHLLVEGDSSKPPHAILGARFVIEELCGISSPTYADFPCARSIANDTDPRVLAAVSIAYVISCHHTGLTDLISPLGFDDFAARVFREDLKQDYKEAKRRFENIVSIAECKKLFEEAIREFTSFQAKIKTSIGRHCKTLSESRAQMLRNAYFGMLLRELTSTLINADRDDAYRWSIGQEGALKANPSLSADWNACNKAVEEYSAKRHAVCAIHNPTIAEARESIARCCIDFAASTLKPGIFRLTAETGSGKTTAVLRMLTLYAKQTDTTHRIIYIAPFKSILLQNADEWREAVGETVEVLEHHSDVVCEDLAQRHRTAHSEQPRSEKEAEEADRRELLVEQWSSPVIVTTLVQFLNTLFSNRPARLRRFQALAGSAIVLDEVQSIPLRFIHMVNASLDFLASCCNCTILCMSATQPALELTPIPLNLDAPADIVPDTLGFASCFKRVTIADRSKTRHTIESLGRFVEERCIEEGSTLVVMNTKRSAVALWKKLKESAAADAFLVTGYQCSAHREQVLSAVKHALDEVRQGTRPPFACVSTSLIEAGVDISFSCGIRAIAGIDSIVQMMGRINRNGEAALANLYLVSHENDGADPAEIKKAGQITRRVLHEQKSDPSSTIALMRYYRYLYARSKNELDYPIRYDDAPSLEGSTLFELLSSNRSDLMDSKPRRNHACQALGTVGRLMRPIDDNAESIIVPYGSEGKRIIDLLLDAASQGDQHMAELFALVRQAQRYTVNLFERDRRALQKHIGSIDSIGVRYLKPECYHEEEGVVFPE